MRKPALIILILLSACQDSSQVLFTRNDFHGVALISDTILETDQVPAKGVRVYLTDRANDTTRYIIFTQTDSTGGFFFDHLPEKKDGYYLYAHYTAKGIRYQSDYTALPTSPTGTTLAIKPNYRAGIKVILKDSVSGSVLNGVTACLFSEGVFSTSPDCSGSIVSAKSNAGGIVFFENQRAGKYFVRVADKVGGIQLSGYFRAVHDGKNNTIGDIKVKHAGIQLAVIDQHGEPVPSAQFCLFTNSLLAKDTVCKNSIRTVTTDAYGKCFLDQLSSATHYIAMKDTLKTTVFAGLTSVNYVAGTNISFTFSVRSRKK